MENIEDVQGRDDEARLALDVVRQGQTAAADRLVTPWWYHPALGGLVAMLVLACGVDVAWVVPVAIVLFSLGLGILVGAYRSTTGMWISGHRAGRASRWAYVLGALCAGCVLVSFVARETEASAWLSWVAAATAFVGTVIIGRRFDTELRDQIRRGE